MALDMRLMTRWLVMVDLGFVSHEISAFINGHSRHGACNMKRVIMNQWSRNLRTFLGTRYVHSALADSFQECFHTRSALRQSSYHKQSKHQPPRLHLQDGLHSLEEGPGPLLLSHGHCNCEQVHRTGGPNAPVNTGCWNCPDGSRGSSA